MRTSTMGSHYSLMSQMLRQQARSAKKQLQVASGKRVLTPSDDPVAEGRILAHGIQRDALYQ